MHTQAITHELIADATALYLAAGGVITRTPDTIEEQRHHLNFLLRLDGADEIALLAGFGSEDGFALEQAEA